MKKKKQEDQFKLLVDYLEKTMIEAGLTDNMMKRAKHEQSNILENLNKIRYDLDKMVHPK